MFSTTMSRHAVTTVWRAIMQRCWRRQYKSRTTRHINKKLQWMGGVILCVCSSSKNMLHGPHFSAGFPNAPKTSDFPSSSSLHSHISLKTFELKAPILHLVVKLCFLSSLNREQRSAVGRMWSTGYFVNKFLVEHSYANHLNGFWSWVVVAYITWPARPKIFLSGLLQKEFGES